MSAHDATDFCIYYEHVIISIGPEPHPAARSPEATAVAAEGLAIYPPISAIGGGPPFHCYSAKWRCLFATKHEPNCVHVLTPFVERLATEEERKAAMVPTEVLNG